MARIIAVCNQKGGVGKTTTSVNLSTYLASLDRRVLLIDFDPQANASSALGYTHDGGATIYHGILNEASHDELIRPSLIFNHHYIPAANHLTGALIELVPLPEREFYLRTFVDRLRSRYDYILIDLPPSLSLLVVNGLLAADEVLIPVQAEYYSLEGLTQLLETIELVNTNLSHTLRVSGAVLTMFDKWERLSQDIARNVRANFPHYVYGVEIPRSVYLAEAPSFGKPILLYAPYSSGALAYKQLAEEVLAQEDEVARLTAVRDALRADEASFAPAPPPADPVPPVAAESPPFYSSPAGETAPDSVSAAPGGWSPQLYRIYEIASLPEFLRARSDEEEADGRDAP